MIEERVKINHKQICIETLDVEITILPSKNFKLHESKGECPEFSDSHYIPGRCRSNG